MSPDAERVHIHGGAAASRVAAKLRIVDRESVRALAESYRVAYAFQAPFVVRIANDMRSDLHADLASAPDGRVVFLGRDAHGLAIATAQLDPAFFRRHCSNLVLSRPLVESALQDLENHQHKSFPQVSAFRPMAPHVDPRSTIGGFRALTDYLHSHHVPVGRPGSRVTVVDTSFKGTVQELLAAMYPATTFQGRYAFLGESPHDPHPGSKKGYEVNLRVPDSNGGCPVDSLPADVALTFAHQNAIGSIEETMNGPMTSPTRIERGRPAQTGVRNQDRHLDDLNHGLVSPRFTDPVVREGVKVVNLLALRQYAQDTAAYRDLGADQRRRLERGAQRYRGEVRSWIGSGSADPGLTEILDSFVWRNDRPHRLPSRAGWIGPGSLRQTQQRSGRTTPGARPTMTNGSSSRTFSVHWGAWETAMGEGNNPEGDPVQEWQSLVGMSESYDEFSDMAE